MTDGQLEGRKGGRTDGWTGGQTTGILMFPDDQNALIDFKP